MSSSLNTLQAEISRLIVDSLNLEDIDPASIDPQAALFGDGLGLDSIDALEIGVAISKRYGLKLKSQNEESEQHFSSVESLAKFVETAVGSKAAVSGARNIDRAQMLEELQDLLVSEFDLERDRVTPDALLYDDLDIDSIDAVDLMAWLVKITGQRMNPEDFKNVRTVNDVIDEVERRLS